jgi:benzoate-CoA ligase family protein
MTNVPTENSNQTSFNLYHYFFDVNTSDATSSKIAIAFQDQRFTYDDLKTEVRYWAQTLIIHGIQKGDRVALLLYDSPEFIAAFLATVAIGAIVIPINTFVTNQEIKFLLADSGSKLMITVADLAKKFELNEAKLCQVLTVGDPEQSSTDLSEKVGSDFVIAETTRNTPAFILYTSGSTGTPKGALHSHGNVEYTIETYAKKILKLSDRDRVFSASRLFFAYGLGNSLSFPLAAKATVILESERPTPQKIAQIFREQSPTVFFGVPAVYRGLLDLHQGRERLDTTSLRLCISAGEALPAPIFDEWLREFGMEIIDGIGSTEMLHIFISNREGNAQSGSTGMVVEGYEAKLLDDEGKEIVNEGTGNLFVKGESAMLGYWQKDELTASVWQDGWMKTGDVYQRDEVNFFYHLGRSDDCFKVKGLWVSPVEVESALLSHPNVAEAAVVASTDKQGLATVKAFLVIRTEQDMDSFKNVIYEYAKARLANYKVPTQFTFIKAMPRTSTGKVQRFKLRKI